MKKLTLLLVATLMITGGAFAQDKACCKKGGHKGACCKDKKECSKDSEKSKSTNTGKSEPAKPKS